MELIILSKGRGALGHLRLTSRRVWLGLAGIALAVSFGMFYSGYLVATHFGIVSPSNQVAVWRADLAEQEAVLEDTRKTAQDNLDAGQVRLQGDAPHWVRSPLANGPVLRCAGPWRTTGGWWSEEERFAFDHFDVLTEDGTISRLRFDHVARRWQIDAFAQSVTDWELQMFADGA